MIRLAKWGAVVDTWMGLVKPFWATQGELQAYERWQRWVMAYTFNIGSIRCHILSDGLQYVDGGGFFGLIPRQMWQEIVAPNAFNQIPVDSRCLLIESDAGLILVDTGNGDKLSPKVRQRMGMDDRNQRLVGELARVGYRPEDDVWTRLADETA